MTRAEYIASFGGFIGDINDHRIRFRDLAAEIWDNASHENQETITDDRVLTEDESNLCINVATDALTITLPIITADNLGMKFKFRNTGADGNNTVTISPNAVDGINGSIPNAAADSVASGTVNKDLVNTKATSNNGDWVEIVAVALTKWYIAGGIGIWASEG